MTQREKFTKEMKSRGFITTIFQGEPFSGRLELTPRHRKTEEGHHNIINSINFVIWGGKGTRRGDLGCVSFYYGGVQRQKYHREGHASEILKKAFCPKTVKEVIKTFDIWSLQSQKTIDAWKVIL